MRIEKILVTPKVAKQYLESNTRNRNIKIHAVNRYAKDIKAGKWKKDTGDFIRISKTGVVLDGQHRLTAILKAQTSIELDFIFGLEDSIFTVIDTGVSRTKGDLFKIDGVRNANQIPAIISFQYALENGRIWNNNVKNKLTNSECLEEYYKKPEYWQDIMKISSTWYREFSKILNKSFIGGFYATLLKIDKDKAYSFMNQLCTGNDISNKMINKLRQKLIQDKLATKKIKRSIKTAFVIKTWNLFLLDKELKILYFDSKREKYPKLCK